MREEAYMRRALTLAARARGNTSPNPMVGALVVAANGTVVGEGFHERAGAPHAETVALDRAGRAARGGTLYVSLEPCAHHGRTPPCVPAIVAAGVSRVVVAMEDPDEHVRGTGIAALRESGIDVSVGVGAEHARWLNRMYYHHRRTGRPYVTVKMAQSIDGAVAATPGEQRRLTGKKAAAYVRALRYAHDAVMVGAETVLIDDPLLTVRPHKARAVPYERIVVDSTARLPLRARLVSDRSSASTLIAVTSRAPRERIEALRDAGVEILNCATTPESQVDLPSLLKQLGRRGMLGVLCEGGPILAGSLLAAGLMDELQLIVAPLILGGTSPVPVFAGVDRSISLVLREPAHALGEDALLIFAPREAAT